MLLVVIEYKSLRDNYALRANKTNNGPKIQKMCKIQFKG